MECPACSRQLQLMDVGDIVVDVCENGCGGIWFDNLELDKVDEQHEAAGEKLLNVARDANVKVDHAAKRPCPRCSGQMMLKHFVSIKREVEVDECPACGGLWLDCGELSRMREQYKDQGERKAAAKAYFDEMFGGEFAALREANEQKLGWARKVAHAFRFVCPSYYVPGEQSWGAF